MYGLKSDRNTSGKIRKIRGRKKRQATHIAPLQPPILAVFRPWGGSVGAGRMRPAGGKYRVKRLKREGSWKENHFLSFAGSLLVAALETALFPKRFLMASTALYKFSLSSCRLNRSICIPSSASWLKRTPISRTGRPF